MHIFRLVLVQWRLLEFATICQWQQHNLCLWTILERQCLCDLYFFWFRHYLRIWYVLEWNKLRKFKLHLVNVLSFRPVLDRNSLRN